MAQVAVNKDGTEVMGDILERAYINQCYDLEYTPLNETEIWVDVYCDYEEGDVNISIKLPKGTIKKLIGRDLTWEDEPVELV